MRVRGSRSVRRLLNWLVLLPLAIVIVLFAVANRTWVTVSFDPFPGDAPALAFTVPLFIVAFAGLIVGVVIGGLVSLARQWRLWRAARAAQDELARMKAEVESMHKTEEASRPEFPSLPFSG
jgi:uncharacterized integral membrane protein